MTPPAIDPEHFRRLGHALVDLVTDHFAGIRERPVFRPMQPAERATLMQEALGEAGARPEVIIERSRTAVLPHAMGNGHPRFFGWVNSPPAPIGVLADFLAAAMNPSCAGGDHAAIYVERAAWSPPAQLGFMAAARKSARTPIGAGGELTQPKKRGWPFPMACGRTAVRKRSMMTSGRAPASPSASCMSVARSAGCIGRN